MLNDLTFSLKLRLVVSATVESKARFYSTLRLELVELVYNS